MKGSGARAGAWGRGLYLGLCAGVYLRRSVAFALPEVAARAGDFRNYYLAAREILEGRSPFGVAGFDYPPLAAVLVLPLAPLPYGAARLAWFFLGHGLLLAAAALLWRRLGGGRGALLAVATAWALGGTVAENLVLGQVGPLLLLLLVVSWVRPGAGPVALGAAAALKVWPGALFLAYPLVRRWRALGAAVAAAALLLVLPWGAVALLLPPPRAPTEAGYWLGTPALLNLSLPAVALRLADPPRGGELPRSWVVGDDPRQLDLPPSAGLLSAAVAGGTFLLGLGLLARVGPQASRAEPLVSAALVSLTLAAAPIAWYHYQLLQFPGAALLGAGYLRTGQRGRLALLAALFAGLTWTGALGIGAYVERYGWTAAAPAALWVASSLVPVLSLGLFGLFWEELRKGGRR